jgi:carbon-monoxide dehydrogenase medium subunit
VKAAPFEYVRPRDMNDALNLLSQGEDVKLLAGGQSMGPMMNLRLVRPRMLVDISSLDALRQLTHVGDAWRIGAAVTHAQIEDGSFLGLGILSEVAGGIAYRSVRNRGTIGGSLAHADPAADWPLALAALGAVITIRSQSGTRDIPAEALCISAFTTALKPGEIIESVAIPKLTKSARHGYSKFCRKTGEFPEASAAVILDPERRVARIFIGALNGAPQPLPALSQMIAKDGLAACTQQAVADAVKVATPHIDELQRRMHITVLSRTIQQTLQ